MINFKNKVVRGSIILLILVGIFNALNFFYHILMVRIMPIEDFGMLKRVFAFLYIGAIFMESIQTVVVKYSSNYRQDKGKLKSVFLRSNKGIIWPAIIVGISFLFLSIIISPVFNIAYHLLFATSIFIIFSMFVPIARGILQGQQRFLALGFSMFWEAAIKIVASFLLVYFGLGVFGAVWGVVLSLVLSLGLTLIYLRKILSADVQEAKLEGIRSYSKPVFVITAVLILFINIDILIAGNIFADYEAGIYAIASTIALILFIAVQPINKVLFPISVVDSINQKRSKSHFTSALGLVIFICVVGLGIIILFTPELIYIISGKYLPQAILPTILLSSGTAFLSLSSTILYYKLSNGKTKGYLFILLFLAVEMILLITMAESLTSYALGFLIANVMFFIGSLVLLRE